jgi:nitrate/TMAO reductase-like tetraheme cytochrome c subunit
MSWSVLVAAGIVAGIVLWGGFNWAIELTNNEAFCISCHEMRDNVYPELQQTIHWKNRSGVRAICLDCHVPRPWIYKIKRKIEASNEVLHKILGTIDTREKFEAHRLEFAQYVWATARPASIATRASRIIFPQNRRKLKKQERSRRNSVFLPISSECDFLAISERGPKGSHNGEQQ